MLAHAVLRPVPHGHAGKDRRKDAALSAARAHATLLVGCSFVTRHGLHGKVGACAWSQTVSNRTTANRLRELDRFLWVLMDAVACALGEPVQDDEAAGRAGRAGKRRSIEMIAGLSATEHGRLRAIRRVAARLRHDDRPIHQSSLASDLMVAMGNGPEDSCFRAQGKLCLSFEAVQSISTFYREIGDRTISQLRDIQINIDISTSTS